MNQEELSRMKQDYAALLALCKGGTSGSAPVPDDKLKKALHADDFCAICASSAPQIDFLLKLFSLQGWFADHAPISPPANCDESAAQAYLDACADLLCGEVTRAMESGECDPAVIASQAILENGAHFSGKLIHSSASGPALFVREASTSQPHVSSRSLASQGIGLPLDQSRLDNTGAYQRVLKIIEGDELVGRARVPQRAVETIRSGVLPAICEAQARRPLEVDHRLRQILLPDGESYLAVSPLAAGGWCALADQAAQSIEVLEAEESALQKVEREAQEVTDVPSPPKKRGRPANLDAQSDKKNKAPKPRRLSRMSFPVGGAIVRNVSLYPKSVVQNALYFEAPQRNTDLRRVWSFVFAPTRLRIIRQEIEQIQAQMTRVQDTAFISSSSSLIAVQAQASGALAALVWRLHQEMRRLSALICESSYPNGDADVAIDEDLLRAKRKAEPTALDLCLVRGSFGADYRAAMAQTITDLLHRLVRDEKTQVPMLSMVDHERIGRAIEKMLEAA